jgi:hypothetical protein
MFNFWTIGTTIILNDPRFKVDYEMSTNSYILTIDDVQETDGAIYQVQIPKIVGYNPTARYCSLQKMSSIA